MPKLQLATKEYEGIKVRYRPGTTDEKVLREVITCRAYRRASVGFDVEAGEHWLDLGANIGAFAVYCAIRGATVDCFEPEPESFKLLERNVGSDVSCIRGAVSNSMEPTVPLWQSSIKGNYYRGTLVGGKGLMQPEPIEVCNIYAGDLLKFGRWDGIKIDIEGSEFGLLDDDLIPPCNKLCLEYHTSRDNSMVNLKRRVAYLRERFDVVSYVPELDRIMEKGGFQKSFHDRVIYCIGAK